MFNIVYKKVTWARVIQSESRIIRFSDFSQFVALRISLHTTYINRGHQLPVRSNRLLTPAAGQTVHRQVPVQSVAGQTASAVTGPVRSRSRAAVAACPRARRHTSWPINPDRGVYEHAACPISPGWRCWGQGGTEQPSPLPRPAAHQRQRPTAVVSPHCPWWRN